MVGKSQVDYKSNCGNMTAAVGPYAVEEGIVTITEVGDYRSYVKPQYRQIY
ncbi:MAG: PrpF domain-containing protein [Clostridium sp.]